ncbi:WD40 repeat domain-containing serine/threonine protein kinase [Nonomuraea sp. NPDC002799]
MTCSPLVEGDPQRIGHYALAGRLGAGGQGVVFEGYGPGGERVAIKVLHAAASLLRPPDAEVAALSRVAPFCTARIVDFDLDAERPYIVSEFVPGTTLRAAVQRHGPLHGDELHRLGVGIATALVAIHRAGVVHRDLKPDNVLLSPDGPRVIDFGIARLLTSSVSTGAHGAVGTPMYMAPEVWRGALAGQAADVYGWAAVMLHAASGRPPYRAQAPAVELAEPLRSLVLAGLAERPEDRPPARDLLLRLLEHRVEPAGLMEAGSRAAGTVGARDAGVEPPLGERAERAFAALPTPAQAAVPGVLLRLIGPGDQLRAAAMDELGDDPAVPAVVEGLCRDGLLLRGDAEVRIAAPALPVAWPRLNGWLAEERPGLADHDRLRDAARVWSAHGHKDADLHQGSALERDNRWAGEARRNLRLNAVERRFLAASTALAARRRRRRRLLLAALTALLSVTAILGTLAETQRRTVTTQRDEAIARRLAARVPEMRSHAPNTALLLSVAAWRVSPVPEARTTLLSSLAQADVRVPISSTYLSVSAQGHILSYDSDFAKVWTPGARSVSGAIRSKQCCANSFLSPDGSALLAIDSYQSTTRVFDVRSGRRRSEVAAGGNSAAFNLRGDRAATFTFDSSRPVSVFDMAGGELVTSLTRKEVTAVALSPDGATLALAVADRRVELVDVASGRTTRSFAVPLPADEQSHDKEVRTVRFSPDGKTLVTDDPELRFWAVDTGAERPEHAGHGRVVDQVAFDASGRWMATPDNQGLQLWDLRTGASVTILPSLPWPVDELGFAADGRSLSFLMRGEIRVADISAYTTPLRLSGMGEAATSVAIAGRAYRAATYAPDGVRVWDLRSRRQVGPTLVFSGGGEETSPCAELSLDAYQTVALSADGTRLAAVVPDGSITIGEVATGREIARLSGRPAHVRDDFWRVMGLAFSPDGNTLAVDTVYSKAPSCGDEEAVRLWTADPSWRQAHVTRDVRGRFAFTPDGRQLIALDADGIARIDVATGRIDRRIDISKVGIGFKGLAPDPRYALVSGRPLYLTDLVAGKLIEPPLADDGAEGPTAASSDGRTLATVDYLNRVRIRDMPTETVADLAFPGPVDAVLTLAFSPDGGTLYSLTSTGAVFSDVTDPERAVALLCARAGGELTGADWDRYLPELPYREVCPR